MYADPTLIRVHTVKVRLNEEENALIDALVSYRGGQKAALMRELMMQQVRLELEQMDQNQVDYALRLVGNKGP